MLYHFKTQPYKNKMYTAKNMDFHHECVDMSESIEYSQVEMGNQSPIFSRNQIPAFRTFPKIMPNYASVGDLFEAMSIQEQIMAHPTNHPGYKCYRCYGTNRDIKVLNGEANVCSQCDGTEFVPHNNGLATILDRLLTLKVPHLANRIQEPPRRVRDCLLNYGSQRSIKEESFVYPDSTTRECSNCMSEAEISRTFSCTVCPEYFLCSSCHDRKKYSHPPFHEFTRLNNFPSNKISVRFISDPRTMKKISQQVQSEQTSNIVQSSASELEVKCHNCNNYIQECYMNCLNCQTQGNQYVLCPQCSRDAAFIHDSSHKLDLKAIPQASKLIMSAKPSASQSEMTQPTPSKSKSRIKYGESLVIFDNQFDLEEDGEIPIITLPSQHEESPFSRQSIAAAPFSEYSVRSNSDAHACEDLFAKMSAQPQIKQSLNISSAQDEGEGLAHFLIKKKQKRRQNSVVNIDMQTSIELHPSQKSQEFQATIIPFSFSTVTSQLVTQRSIQSNPEQYIFNDYECDICKISPIKNKRYHCRQCQNYDLCETCFIIRSKRHQHKDYQLIDGLELIKKHRESMMKLDQVRCKLPVSRMSQSRLSHSRTRTDLSKI